MRSILFVVALMLGAGVFAAATGVFDSVGGLFDGEGLSIEQLEANVDELFAAMPEPGTDGPSSSSPDAPRVSPEPAAESGGSSIYKYVDDAGNLQFVSSLSQVPARFRDQAKPAGNGTVSRADARKVPRRSAPLRMASARASARTHEVVVYTTKWCGYCRKTIAWLEQNGVDYQNRDIEAHDLYRQELLRKSGGTSVPFIEIGDRQIRGYNPSMLQALLKSG